MSLCHTSLLAIVSVRCMALCAEVKTTLVKGSGPTWQHRTECLILKVALLVVVGGGVSLEIYKLFGNGHLPCLDIHSNGTVPC